MAECTGKFKLTSNENFDDYLKAIGLGMATRALAKAATPTVEYSVNGDEWTVKTTGMKDTITKFKLGVEQDEDTPDGRKVKSLYTKEGNKIVQVESWKDKTAKYVREFNGDDLVVTITLDNITCVRKYKRV